MNRNRKFFVYLCVFTVWYVAFVYLVLTHRPSMPQPQDVTTVQLPADPLNGSVSPRKTTR